MKKRTFVCFLIFTLCVFHSSLPGTAFAQDASLAEQVLEKYSETLQREDIQEILPDVLEGLKAPNIQALLTPQTITLVVTQPDLLTQFVPGIDPAFVTLLKTDAELKTMLQDAQVQELLTEPAAIDELAAALNVVEPPVEMPPSLAEQVFAKHSATLMRADVQAVLPDVLTALKAPETQALLNPAIIDAAIANPAILATQGVDQVFIDLLETDAELQAMLNDAQVQALLQNTVAIDELAALLNVGEPPVVEPPVVEPPVVEPPVEPPVVEPPVEPPVVEPPVVEPPPVAPPVGQADPFEQITPANESILGKSRLGGLDNNRLSGRQFVSETLEAMGISLETLAAFGYTQDKVIDEIFKLVPNGMLPKKQIKQVLASKHIKYFDDVIDGQDLGQQLDYENFGNAITPMLLELAYQNEPNRKYVTRDNLNVYARVPSANVGGVTFNLTNGRTVEGTQITSAAFGADTFPYTFRLEETLAATNLPAWPGLSAQLFSNVVLRYSQTGLNGDYIAVNMQPTAALDGGVVWETEIGVTAGSTYYYFEVTLAEPVTLEVLDREKIAAIVQHVLGGNTVSPSQVLEATKGYTIEGWAMPDPRNLQLADRGIINAIFTADFKAALLSAMAGPISKAVSGQQPTANDIVNALRKHQRGLQNILLRNANALTTQFENAFDPMLSSVFTLPRIDAATESIWAASIDSIADGNYYLGAVVHDANGNPLDQMQGEFTVDTSAPEAGIHITPGANATGYVNAEGVYVATAPATGTTATLHITGTPKVADVAPGEGYLFYQEIKLDADGTPQSAWMPLTIDATMLSSRIWDETLGQLERQGAIPQQFSFIQGVPFEQVLALLSPGLVQQYANPFLKQYVNPVLKSLAPNLGDAQLSEEDSQTLLDILGATIDLINSIPITYGEPNNTVTMAIQGEQMPLLLGDYGVRAMGIDTLFNISAHTAPTHVRIVSPEYDTAAVTLAVIGDCNGDGDTDDPGESGAVGDLTIYSNTTANVMLTVAIGNRTAHPASVMVQYMDASGAWQNINEVDLGGVAAGDTLEVSWNVADFDALVGAGSSVMVRAIATNALGLADPAPVAAQMMLDAGICPVVPEVLTISVSPAATTNPDSGGPQGVLTLNATTPERTTSPITSVRFEAKRSSDTAWNTLGTATSSTAQQWGISVDTTTLEDSITGSSPAARDVSRDSNPYTVRAIAIANGTEYASSATATFSVDNIDDVGPVGPTTITSVADIAGVIGPDPSGAYTVGGIVDDSVASPVATFTLQPTAAADRYASVRLVQTAADGTVTNINGETGETTITVDVGKLDNGQYSFHALAMDAAGNVQTDSSPAITVNVSNFRVTDISALAVTAVDGVDVPTPPAEPILVRESLTVGFTVANGTVSTDELSATVNRQAATSEITEDPENTFAVKVNVSELTDGTYTVQGVVTQRNGSVPFDLATITAAFEVLALTVDSAGTTNPDSGAPQGTITINAYTSQRSTSGSTSIRLEAQRSGDTEWKAIGTADESTAVAVEGQELADILADLAGIAASGRKTVPIATNYWKWPVSIDTTALEDTITADSPAARDASKDDNPYMVRAVLSVNGTEIMSPVGVTATFSVDNDDDVAPVGPTAILLVEDVAGVITPNEKGVYTVGGIVDDSVASPVATFTLQPTAAADTYASVRLVQTAADGTVTNIDGETGDMKITVDVGALENAQYSFHALAVDAAGNVQTDESPTTTANVRNFRVKDVSDVAVTAVDGRSVENPASPVVHDSVTISLTVANGTVAAAELSVTINSNAAESETTEEQGHTFSLTVDVSTLPDGKYTPNAVVTQRNGSVSIELPSITVAPQIEAITIDAAEKTNPDSGAPQGTLTLNGYTSQRATSDTTTMRFEAKRRKDSDTEWKAIGTTKVSDSVAIEGQEIVGIIEDLVGTVASGHEEVPIVTTARKWTASIDTTELEDTITADSPAARDVSKDDNTYTVRAVLSVNGTEIMSPAGVTATFSVDNVDDVAPVGPTAILLVEDVAGEIIPDEAGAYTVGGIVDDSVNAPVATFTVQPTAAADTYASVRLVQTTEDGTVTDIDGEAGEMKITVDVGALENAQYSFHALAVDAAGNVQTDESPTATVNVLNFRLADISDVAVTAVDGEAVAEPPAEPIPLTTSVTVSLTVANGSLSLEDVTGVTVNGSEVPSETVEEPENTFALTVDMSGLPDGLYTPSGVITQRNGSVSFPLSASDAMINVDNTPPTVTIEAPLAGHTIDSLPTVLATYEDGAGAGVDGATGSVVLMRIRPNDAEDEEVAVDQAMLEKDVAQLVYTRNEQLPGGAYSVTVQVADILGNVGEASAEFAISGTIPTVAIQSPLSGQTFEHGKPLISGEFSGAGALTVTTFTVDGADATPVVDGERFSYTPADALADGEHTVVVEVTDSNGKTAQTSVVFTVEVPKDKTPPVISEAAPSGLVKGDSWVTISAVVTDEQSAVVSVRFGIDDKPLRSVPPAQIAEGRVNIAESFTPGTHTLKVVAISEGGTTEHSWTFTLVVDNVAPTITSITPSGTIRAGLPTISASANDESGVDKMSIAVMDSNGEEVKGSDEDDGEDDVEGITRIDFIPENPLDEGTYTIEVRATDTIGNSATAKGTFTVDFDTAAPVITMSSPQQDARLTERRPTISITYADAESGVDVDSIRFVFDDQLINLTPQQKSASQVVYVPLAELAYGQHTVKLEVSDMAHKEGNVSDKNSDARQANMAVHEFSFFVESEEGPVLAARPINAPNPFKENTRISFTLTRQSTVSIVIYDITGRPVRVLVDKEVWDAGEYTGKNAIGWDGTTTGGEDLARGIYFCQIMVAEGFEPEYAILKLALTR